MQEIRTPGMQQVVLSEKSLADYAPVVGEDVIAELSDGQAIAGRACAAHQRLPRMAAASRRCCIR